MTTLKQVKAVASGSFTWTVAALATDANLKIGRASSGINNDTNQYVDYHIAGVVTTGTTPTANTVIEIWAIGARNDTPTWPDTFGGADAGITITSRNVLMGFGRQIATLQNDVATSNIGYPFGPISIAQAFGGIVPIQFQLWVVHNTGVNLLSGSAAWTGYVFTST